MTTAKIVQPEDKELVGIDRLAGADHGVPPAHVLGVVGVIAGNMMMAGQRVANQDRVGFIGIQLAISLIHQLIARQHRTAAEYQRGAERCALCADDAYAMCLSLIHISEPTRLGMNSYAVFCLKKKKNSKQMLDGVEHHGLSVQARGLQQAIP